MKLVMKFGGTGINSGTKISYVANLIKNHRLNTHDDIVVVVSAVRGVTDMILSISDSVRKGDKASIEGFITDIRTIHMNIIRKSLKDENLKNMARCILSNLVRELRDILEGMVLLAEVTPKSLDYLLSFGERLSTPILCMALQQIGLKSRYLTGMDVGILTDSNFGEAHPLMNTTRLRITHMIEPLLKEGIIPVVTGYIARDQNGSITTLGRGGSDYTATIIASSINADEVWLWSDVNGLMTADPRIIKDAKVLTEVSFAEAIELALFGAKYIHPRTLEPVMSTKIPIRIRNTFNVEHSGTLIIECPSTASQKTVKSISAIRHTALIDVSGEEMVGAPGTAAKIFEVLARSRINIMMISQSPSESSISMVVRKGDLDRAITALELNLLGKTIKKLNVNEDVAVIAVVGSGMRGIKGIAARVFSSVSNQDVNVIMIAQGSSELNLAFVVKDDDCYKAVKALHDEFKLGKVGVSS